MDAAAAYPAPSRATTRQAEPTPAISSRRLLLGELRGALGDERVALAHEGAVPELALDDHLAAVVERVRDLACVAHRHRGAAVAVADAAEELAAAMPDRAVHVLAGHLVRAAGLDLRGLAGLRRCAEARVDEGRREHDSCPQGDDEADSPLAGRVHLGPAFWQARALNPGGSDGPRPARARAAARRG